MITLAIVGACGLVGAKMTEIVADKLPDIKIRLFGNSSVGRRVQARTKILTVESCDKLLEGNLDYALFAATNEISERYIPQLIQKGVICIDNSSAFRLCDDVPLVVPTVNDYSIGDKRLIANPNCSTIQVVTAVNALKDLGLKKLTAVTYQSASGAGKDGLCDLLEKRSYGKLQCFNHPIYDNVIPCIGETRKDGFTSEERKLVDESRKILNLPKLKVNGFCARIPVTVGHGVFVNLLLKERFTLNDVREKIKNAPNVLLMDDTANGVYPMPSVIRHTKYTAVGRITKDPTANAVNMFVAADNLLRGAAYNAYEILKLVMERDGE